MQIVVMGGVGFVMGDLDKWLQPDGPVPSAFKLEVQRILLKETSVERKLNAIEAAHKRHRNMEIEKRKGLHPNKSAFSRALFGGEK